IAVSSGSPIEYTLNTAYKPSGTYTCVNHEYKLEKYQKSTCTKNGYKDYKCAICNTTYREILNKTSHINVKDKAVAATFNSSGLTEGSHCSVCGAIIKKQTVVAKLGSPKLNKVSTGKKQFKAVWKAISRVDGYQIQYSTNSEFKKGNKTVTCKGYSATSKVVGKLKAKKKYYVRVRAYKKINGKNVYSKWSAKKTVKTK
ncbi:MAG: fibronectin type III domain-containing protein, partial [Eubacterium sp.]|nr:fibronectin type III domain-containing protein [Eubacterium sp.]